MTTVLLWNCCGGLASKIDTINTIIAKYNPSLLFVYEAEVTPHNIDLLSVKGYKPITSSTLVQGKPRNVCHFLGRKNKQKIKKSFSYNGPAIIALKMNEFK